MRTYEAVIWDDRHSPTYEPSSILGKFDCEQDAIDAINRYLENVPTDERHNFKMQIIIEGF